jgi:conjugative transfer signal peptidase TraF
MRGALRTVIVSVVASGATATLLYACGVRIVVTDSVPRGAYKRDTKAVARRGDYVFVCLPPAVVADAMRRNAVAFPLAGGGRGDCAGGIVPLVKRVVALSGDVVEFSDRGVAIAGQMLPDSGVVNARVEHFPFGRYELGAGQAWVLGRGRSWDSRFFGTVAIDAVATPLLLVDRP